jgi:excinuclease ABC subunit C
MDLAKARQLNIPSSSGCYFYYNRVGKIIYVGKAVNLKSRVLSYWLKSANHSSAKQKMLAEIIKISWEETDSEIEALLLEANLIKKHQPYYNIMLRDDKRHVYIKISTEDEIPGVFITRTIDKAGKYFGPFIKSESVKQVLKIIRKIWPYCTMRKTGDKPCFFYQISRCTGVCGQMISVKEYQQKIIRPITLFLEGKKQAIVQELSNEQKAQEKVGNLAEAGKIAFYLKHMDNVLKSSNILSLADKYVADVIELAKLLSLPKIPRRIEGYDISNIFGQDAVGSMVVFIEGEAEKSSYRKFKIKDEVNYKGDTDMLRQVLERRFARAANVPNSKFQIPNSKKIDQWPLPDLIVIDGGRGQLNVASKILHDYNLNIPVLAISKGDGLRSSRAHDKLFFPGQSEPLELPLASPALHLIKRVRDEAHRFAIGYHRVLRKKKTFPARKN